MVRFKLLGSFIDKNSEVKYHTIVLQITKEDNPLAKLLVKEGIVTPIGDALYKYNDSDREMALPEYVEKLNAIYSSLYNIEFKKKAPLDIAVSLQLADFERHMPDKYHSICRELATLTRQAIQSTLGTKGKILSNFTEEIEGRFELRGKQLFLKQDALSYFTLSGAVLKDMGELQNLYAYTSISFDMYITTEKQGVVLEAISAIKHITTKIDSGVFTLKNEANFIDLRVVLKFIETLEKNNIPLRLEIEGSKQLTELYTELKSKAIYKSPVNRGNSVYIKPYDFLGRVELTSLEVEKIGTRVVVTSARYKFNKVVTTKTADVVCFLLGEYYKDCTVFISEGAKTIALANENGISIDTLKLTRFVGLLHGAVTFDSKALQDTTKITRNVIPADITTIIREIGAL